MSKKPTRMAADLDGWIGSVGFPVRPETLARAWKLTADRPASRGFHDRVRRTVNRQVPAGEVMLLVTMRAKSGRAPQLAVAAREFVEATKQLMGALGSTVYRSSADPLTFTLVERFAEREVLTQHMASEYFQRFQIAQRPLLAGPVEAVFYQRVTE